MSIWARRLAPAFTAALLSVGIGAVSAYANPATSLRGTLAAAHTTLPGTPSYAVLTPFTSSLAAPPIVWSLSAPSEPLVAGASGVVFANGLLYVTSYSETAGHSSLAIVNPATHEIVGSITNPELDGAASLAVSGSYAYVTGVQNRKALTNANRLTIVDVSNPADPTIVGSVQNSEVLYGAYGVQVAGNLAYVAAQGCVPKLCEPSNATFGNRLVTVDVSEKAHPRIVGSVAQPTGATDHLDAIALAGDRVYGTAFKSETLTVFDVGKPTEPAILGTLTSPLLAGAADVVVRGRYAYVIDQSVSNARLVVVDVSDEAHPTIVGSVLDPTDIDEGYWLKLVGHDVFVASANSDAMAVIDVSNPAQPQVVASTISESELGVADGIDVGDTTAYVAAFCTESKSCSSSGALTALEVAPYTHLDLTSGPPAVDPSATAEVGFTAPVESTTFSCSLDGATPLPCTSPWVASSPLAAGSHSLAVTASTDPIPATWSWTADPPAEETKPPAEETTPPVNKVVPPAEKALPPVEKTVPTTTPPIVEITPSTVAIASSSATYSHRETSIVLTCTAPVGVRCQGKLELKLRTVLHSGVGGHRKTRVRVVEIASVSYNIAAGENSRLHVMLNAAGRAALVDARGRRLQVQASATLLGGKPATRVVALSTPVRK